MNKNIKVMIFDEERKSLRSEKFIDIIGNDLETKEGLYPLDESQMYINETDNNVYYLFNVPIPEKLEAENLKNLRRNAALNNIFDYQTKKPFDLMSLMPYFIIALLIMFM